jgi:hypothetical protein
MSRPTGALPTSTTPMSATHHLIAVNAVAINRGESCESLF